MLPASRRLLLWEGADRQDEEARPVIFVDDLEYLLSLAWSVFYVTFIFIKR